MKMSRYYLIGANLGVILLIYQNCGQFAPAPFSAVTSSSSLASTSSGSDTSSSNQDAGFLAALSTVDLQFAPFLSPLGVSAANINALSSSATDTSAMMTAMVSITNQITAGSSQIAALSGAEAQLDLTEVNSAISSLQSFDSTKLSARAQVLQTANLKVLSAVQVLLKANVAANGSSSGGSSVDNTAAFVAVLNSDQMYLNSALQQLQISATDIAAFAPANITNNTVSAAAISTAESDITSSLKANAKNISLVLSASEISNYETALTNFLVAIQAYPPSTLSAGAQKVQAGTISVINELNSYLKNPNQ